MTQNLSAVSIYSFYAFINGSPFIFIILSTKQENSDEHLQERTLNLSGKSNFSRRELTFLADILHKGY